MKRKYVKPEAEMMKFIEAEEIMTASITIPGLDADMGIGDKLEGWQ